ncbi:TetR/AcrR family transcriptional regulator [Youngiibacter fragilis]|uniref:HTH tetR-type domain-containing protein n=1 Tax=Youngiibacter fragilis 232.1 TaxID=994573 RepID=V7HZR5_9CLOT|nr:TetR/AcrR family transcriptional regulator [Youngiibacter fragilis]ETA79480.1 hypothetical protein T472_0216815 [Youngiibacter fragilis 232.1]
MQHELKYQQQKSENTRALLISTAKRLFREQGYESVGVREIAAAAGVTTGTFYYYFKTKYDILDAIYKHTDETFDEMFRKGFSAENIPGKIIEFFSTSMADLIESDGREFTRHRMLQMQIHSSRENSLYINVIELIKRGQAACEIDSSKSAEEINDFIFLVFRGVLYEWCVTDEPFGLHESLRKCITYSLQPFLI